MADVVTGQGVVHTDYHAFWLLDRTSPEGIGRSVSPPNGLAVQTVPGAVRIQTGVSCGNVDITVEVRAAAPEESAELAGWDEVVEIPIDVPGDQLLATSLFTFMEAELPNLAAAGPGPYRLRVFARGRDTAVDRAESGVEQYRVVAWPAPSAPPAVLKATDDYGDSVRARQPIGVGPREVPGTAPLGMGTGSPSVAERPASRVWPVSWGGPPTRLDAHDLTAGSPPPAEQPPGGSLPPGRSG